MYVNNGTLGRQRPLLKASRHVTYAQVLVSYTHVHESGRIRSSVAALECVASCVHVYLT